MDVLPFTVFVVVEGDFPWCAEAESESEDFCVAPAYDLAAALLARGDEDVVEAAGEDWLCP